jgi:hypothetical protein
MKTRLRKATALMLFIAAIAFSGHSATQEEQPPADSIRTATVKEMQIAGSYVYLLVVEQGEETWLATAPGFVKDIKYGDDIEFSSDVEMQDFHSKALNKTFDSLWFVSRIRLKKDDAMDGTATKVPAEDP